MKGDAASLLQQARWAGQDNDPKWLRILLRQATKSGRADLHRAMRRVFRMAGGLA